MARAAIRDCLDVQSSAQAFAQMMIVMGVAPVMAPVIGAVMLQYFEWQGIFILLSIIGLICLLCVHFFFEETLKVENRLKLNFKQVLILYSSILQDKSFRLPMLAGCLSGASLFCYISSASAVFMDGYGLTQKQFAFAFALNAMGIILISACNKQLARRFSVFQRLKIGGWIQVSGAIILLIAGFLSLAPMALVMLGMFLAVSGIGFTGPNAMAIAMAQQGARAGTASAIMGSAQFACGLIGGIILNFLFWDVILNMAVLMVLFTLSGLIAIFTVEKQLNLTV